MVTVSEAKPNLSFKEAFDLQQYGELTLCFPLVPEIGE